MGQYSRGIFDRTRQRLNATAPVRTFGGQSGTPDPKLKGQKGGNCNITRCQAPGAYAWSMNNHAYYCDACAKMLNTDASNHAYYKERYGVDRFVFRIETLTPEERAAWAAKNGYIPTE